MWADNQGCRTVGKAVGMNIVFSLLTTVLGAAAGLYFSFRLKEREKVMSEVILLIKEISVGIRYTNSEIGEMLKAAALNGTYERLLFVTLCANIKDGDNFHGKWNEGVKSQPYLTLRDREIIAALGDRLGETDSDGQLSFLELTEEMIKSQRDRAAADYLNKGKLYRSVGILCGLAVGIMII